MQISKMIKYFADYYFNSIRYDIINDIIIDSDNMAINTNKHNLLYPYGYKSKDSYYKCFYTRIRKFII